MKIKDILSYASVNLIKEPIDPSDAIGWINDALLELGADAKRITSVSVPVTDIKAWNNLPNDCIKVYEVYNSNGYRYYDYEVDQGRIRCNNEDTYSVSYYKVPTLATSLEDEPDCHQLLHFPLAYYIAGRYIDPRTDNEANIWLTEYQARVGKLLGQLQKKTSRVIVSRWT